MLYRADFALQKQPEHSLMVAISRAWYNGSYTMAAKPIKSLEMHYTMIQFLIIIVIPLTLVGYEMITANLAMHTLLVIYHFISNVHSWNNYKIK